MPRLKEVHRMKAYDILVVKRKLLVTTQQTPYSVAVSIVAFVSSTVWERPWTMETAGNMSATTTWWRAYLVACLCNFLAKSFSGNKLKTAISIVHH